MPINFLSAVCQEVTDEVLFGICDDTPPPHIPAYLNHDKLAKPGWIAEVINANAKEVTFTAIDNCIVIKRANGTDESRCEGMLTYEDAIIFLELKDRVSKGWLVKSRDQLITTITVFSQNHDINNYKARRAHVANAQRPFFDSSFRRVIDEVKTATGFTLEVQRKITI